MVVRKRRKKNKLRGNRTHGGGNTKNRRGAGSRGGRGRAGGHKHKYSKYYMAFGNKYRLKPKAALAAINLDELSVRLGDWAASGVAEKKGSTYIIDGKKVGYGKILSRGSISDKIAVSNMAASRKASEKIIAAGGSIEEAAAETGAESESGEAEE